MYKTRLTHLLLCLTLVLTLVSGIFAATINVAAQEATPTETSTPTPEPRLLLETKYPVLSNDAGQSYTFNVDIKYAGTERKTFNIAATVPQGWSATTTAGYPESQVSAVQITPVDTLMTTTETIKVNVYPNLGRLPDPGDYPITVQVSSGNLTQSIDLTAQVKAKYSLALQSESGRLSTNATAGKENHYSVNLVNSGSAAIDKINFTSTKPDGWIVTFKPDKVDSLGAGQTQQLDVIITPPEGKTIAGDYMINLKADNGTHSSAIDVRVTAATPSIWGYVGIAIVALVIIGLVVLFMRLGRR